MLLQIEELENEKLGREFHFLGVRTIEKCFLFLFRCTDTNF